MYEKQNIMMWEKFIRKLQETFILEAFCEFIHRKYKKNTYIYTNSNIHIHT